jgi:hypothetical protein
VGRPSRGQPPTAGGALAWLARTPALACQARLFGLAAQVGLALLGQGGSNSRIELHGVPSSRFLRTF